jgi:hypothetical protein
MPYRLGTMIGQVLNPVVLADEGAYWKLVNAVPETAIAHAIRATFLATNCVALIRNNAAAAPAGGKHLFMDYLRLIPKVVPASATKSEVAIALDFGATRRTGGGTAITPVNPNGDVAAPSADVVVHFGDVTLSAETANVRKLARAQLRTAILQVGEELLLQFGSDKHQEGTLGGAGGVGRVVNLGPLIIPPQAEAAVHLWHTGNITTAGTYEFEGGFFYK